MSHANHSLSHYHHQCHHDHGHDRRRHCYAQGHRLLLSQTNLFLESEGEDWVENAIYGMRDAKSHVNGHHRIALFLCHTRQFAAPPTSPNFP